MGMKKLFINSKEDWLEDVIAQYRLDEDPSMIRPAFGRGSIADIPGYLKSRLGLTPRRPLSQFMKESAGEVDHMVFFLLDGFGHSTIEHLIANYNGNNLEKFLEDSDYLPVTSVFPSTTSTATVSYQTDLHPLEHGIIGYTSYLSEIGTMCNMITLTPLGKPEHSLLDHGWSVPAIDKSGTIYQEFVKNTIEPHLYLPSPIKGSGMTRITGQGSIVNPYSSLSHMFTMLRRNIEKSVRSSFHFCYISNVDTMSHKVGPYTEETAMEIETIFHHLNEEFIGKVVPDGSLGVAISADHGHIALPPENIYDIRLDKRLSQMLRTPVSGDLRAPVLRIKESRTEEAVEHLQLNYGENYIIKKGKDAISEGLYGIASQSQENSDRFGDVLLFPRKNVGIMDSALGVLDPKLNHFDMIGMHGGLSKEEMIVPFISRTIRDKK